MIDTHTHTLMSGHAYNTMQEMINKAIQQQLDVLCITDHGPAMQGAPDEFYFSNFRVLTKEYYPITQGRLTFDGKYLQVLHGIEANIVDYDGKTDYEDIEDDSLAVKYIIASFHACCLTPADEKLNTQAYIKAMEKGYVYQLGHIDDGNIPCNYEEIIKAAKKNNVLIEVNNSSNSNNSWRKDSIKNTLEYLQLCKENDTLISLASDAHFMEDIANFSNIEPLLKKVNFPDELVVNYNKQLFLDFVDRKYKERLKNAL